jgi:DNA-binding beta-propeller fold protein YncE
MTPATVVAGTNPYSVTVDPLGKYVYVANANSGTVSQYALGAGGGLTPLAPATVVDAAGSAPVPTSITVTAGH